MEFPEKVSSLFGKGNLRGKIMLFSLTIGLVPLLIMGSFAYWASNRALYNNLKNQMHQRTKILSDQIENYFDTSRLLLLVLASNPAWERFYTEPKVQKEWLTEQEKAINYLDSVASMRLDEVCFIDASGRENSRIVLGNLAKPEELSQNEQDNPFFKPTFELGPKEVYQGPPYISPDTFRWVLSNSTIIYGDDGRELALLHYERSLEQMRQILTKIAHEKKGYAFIYDDEGEVLLS